MNLDEQAAAMITADGKDNTENASYFLHHPRPVVVAPSQHPLLTPYPPTPPLLGPVAGALCPAARV